MKASNYRATFICYQCRTTKRVPYLESVSGPGDCCGKPMIKLTIRGLTIPKKAAKSKEWKAFWDRIRQHPYWADKIPA